MKKTFILILLLVFGISVSAEAELIGGVEFPDGENSFADAVVNYSRGGGVSNQNADPSTALGVPDYPNGTAGEKGCVPLGYYGSITLQFTNNALTTSGNDALDLWIFEAGVIEPQAVSISTDGSSWIDVGQVGGATSGIDIDQFAGVVVGESYSYVRIKDLGGTTSYPTAGADIDAVGAISSAPPVNPVPEPSTILLMGLGLLGLAGYSRKRFAKKS